jgi:tetratricopeptide (TPR) repeat protein
MPSDDAPDIGMTPTRPLRQVYVELGVTLAANQRHTEAVAAFAQALVEPGDRPAAVKVRLELARAHMAANDPALAFRTYLEAVLDAPDQVSEILIDAHELLTREVATPHAEWLQREWAPEVTRHTVITSDRVSILIFLGRVRLHLNDYLGARELFDGARQLAPDEPRVLEGLGESLWKAGDLIAARAMLEQANAAARRGPTTRLAAITAKLSQVLAAAGDFEAALAHLEQSGAERNTYAYEMHLVRSLCALGVGNPDDARASAEAAAALKPSAVEPHVLRLRSLITLGKYDEALVAATLAQQTDPSERQIGFYRAQVLIEGQIDIEQGRRLLGRQVKRVGDRVREMVREALRSRDSDGNAHYFAAEAAFAERQFADTIAEVDRALELGLHAPRRYPEAPAQQLKAEALVARGESGDAAQWFSDAGSNFLSRGEHRQAVDNLNRATRLHPTNENWWLLADALSTATDPDAPDEQRLLESAKAWNNGFALGVPTDDQSWAYVVRASIAVQLARVRPPSEQTALRWEAVGYLERAILLYSTGYRWALLCGYHRFLENHVNALVASERAVALDPDDAQALEERIVAASNVGDYDAAQAALAKRLTHEPSDWAQAVQAYLFLHTGKYQEALAAIEAVLQHAPQDVWNLDLRAQCLRALDEHPRALEVYRAINQLSKLTDKDNLTLFGTAAYYLGRLAEATTYFTARLEGPPNEWYGARAGLGLVCLAAGDLEQAEEQLQTAIEIVTLPSYLDDLITFDLPDAERMVSVTPHAEGAAGVLERTKRRIRTRRAELAIGSAEDELRAIAAHLAGAQQTDGWAWIATQAGLARQLADRSAWTEAATIYRALDAFGSRFAEAKVGIAAVVDACEASAQAHLHDGDIEGAIALFREALDAESGQRSAAKIVDLRRQIGLALLRAGRPSDARDEFEHGAAVAIDDRAEVAAFRARMAYAAFELHDRGAARSAFIQAVRQYGDAGVTDPGGSLGDACVDLIDSVLKYWALDAEWASLAASEDVDATDRESLQGARQKLIRYLESAYQLSAVTDESATIPVVTPVALEIGEGLVASDTSTEVWPLFTKYIPDMLQRIRSSMGVDVPGVRVRGSVEIGPGEYIILVDDVPRARGVVQIPGRDEPQAPDPLEFVIAHLETVLRQNLANFVGIQEVDVLLATWRATERTSSLLTSLTADESARVRLARIIRALIATGIPVTNPDRILEAIRAVGAASGSIEAVIVSLRRQLRALLPANDPSIRHVELPTEWTSMLESCPRDGRDPPRLMLTPDQAQQFATALPAFIDSLEPGSAVLVPDAAARSLVLDLAGAASIVPIVLTLDEQVPRAEAAGVRPASAT